ncbi:CgeB family protein [Anaerovorax odorimutans]|uniref:CgeB family protein n=1 Tax=Anaerovorax odorimutans TaxID=109327 RepID=UPI0003F5B999|nr:glycosyltransferase [Anaerovorax odorimutans]
MRILFLENHPMWIYGLPNGFIEAGHEVKVSGELTEEKLKNLISEFKPDLIFTLGWTDEHTYKKKTLIRYYVEKFKIPHIYWATEDPTHFESFTKRFVNDACPNFVFTICSSMVETYKKMGINSAYLDFGYEPSIHKKSKEDYKYKASIGVVANAYPRILKKNPKHYRIQSLNTLLRSIIRNDIRIDFWGRDWDRMQTFFDYNIPNEWIHGYIDYIYANKVYSNTDIVIGLQNSNTQLTQRTYEILGSEGFLITSDTMGIRKLFTPAKDLVVSSSPEETLELVEYYKNHEEEREKIKREGNLTVQKNHTYKHRAIYIINVLKNENII